MRYLALEVDPETLSNDELEESVSHMQNVVRWISPSNLMLRRVRYIAVVTLRKLLQEQSRRQWQRGQRYAA